MVGRFSLSSGAAFGEMQRQIVVAIEAIEVLGCERALFRQGFPGISLVAEPDVASRSGSRSREGWRLRPNYECWCRHAAGRAEIRQLLWLRIERSRFGTGCAVMITDSSTEG
jgi:hypothetical protein